MRQVGGAEYKIEPSRYELRSGAEPEAPDCPFGNRYEWIGYDSKEKEYIRFSKRLFKELLQEAKKRKGEKK